MRRHLMINLFCDDCGEALMISEAEPSYNQTNGQPGDPTGADCRYASSVRVVPCSSCLDKVTGPAARIAEGIKELLESKT